MNELIVCEAGELYNYTSKSCQKVTYVTDSLKCTKFSNIYQIVLSGEASTEFYNRFPSLIKSVKISSRALGTQNYSISYIEGTNFTF